MDPHFHEYLAAIAGMHDVYGDHPDERPTEFHEDHAVAVPDAPPVPVAA